MLNIVDLMTKAVAISSAYGWLWCVVYGGGGGGVRVWLHFLYSRKIGRDLFFGNITGYTTDDNN